MKKTLVILLLLATFSASRAQSDTIARGQRPRVGVTLSGGGAKGAAHIGVLKYMEEIGIPVDYITGTSMGAIVGGLYALGYSPDEMARLIHGMDWPSYMSNNVKRAFQSSEERVRKSTYLLSVPFGKSTLHGTPSSLISTLPQGALNGGSLVNLFSLLSAGYNDSVDFNTLPIPFACVATDVLSGGSVVLRSGNFAKAIRSSMAISGVFSPVEWNGHLLADGGLVNNFPVDVCHDMGADIIVGIEVVDELATNVEDVKSLPQQVSQYMTIAFEGERYKHRAMCDLYMHPDISGYNTLSFNADAIDTLVRRGYECAKAHHDEFMRLKQRVEQYGPCRKTLQAPRARDLTTGDTIVLSSITYKGVDTATQRWLTRKSGLNVGTAVSAADINCAAGILDGTGAYTSITYRLLETDEEQPPAQACPSHIDRTHYNLIVNLEPSAPHDLSIGFRYDSEESASLLFHAGWNAHRLSGFKSSVDVHLNYNFRCKADASWCVLGFGDITLAYNYHNSNLNFYNGDALAGAIIDHHDISLYLSEFHLCNLTFALGLDEDFYADRGIALNNIRLDGSQPFGRTDNFFSTFLKGRFDNLDNAYFATHGLYATATVSWNKSNRLLFTEVDSGFVAASANVQTYLTPTRRLTLVPQLAARVLSGNNAGWYDNMAGGTLAGRHLDHQLAFIGLNNPMRVDALAAVARLDVRYRFGDKYYLYLMADYLCTASSWENVASASTTLGLALRLAYDSPFGPVSADLHWNNFNNRLGAYINVGYVF